MSQDETADYALKLLAGKDISKDWEEALLEIGGNARLNQYPNTHTMIYVPARSSKNVPNKFIKALMKEQNTMNNKVDTFYL